MQGHRMSLQYDKKTRAEVNHEKLSQGWHKVRQFNSKINVKKSHNLFHKKIQTHETFHTKFKNMTFCDLQ